MKIWKIVAIVGFINLFVQINFAQTKYPCLPKGITAETAVSATFASKPELSKRVFVKDELKRLNAKCVGKKLVDSKKRQIKFYKLNNCFGVQPPDYKEIMGKVKQTLAELRKKIYGHNFDLYAFGQTLRKGETEFKLETIMKMRNLILIIFGLIFLISEANGQIFTHKFHGYLEDDPVIFTLTFNRNNGKIFGYYFKAKDGIKRQIVGEFHKPPKVKPIVHPTPKYSGPIKSNNSNLFSLFEMNPKTKVKKKRVSFNYGEQLSSVWTRGNNSDFIDINLFREYEAKLETYQITEKQLIENEQKYEIAMFYPILSGENRNGINGLNQLIEQKIQITINQFKQPALKHNIEDVWAGEKFKWKLTANFYTKYANDRFISLKVTMMDNVMDNQGNSLTETGEFVVNYDLQKQKVISFDDIFEADSENLKAFSKVCKDKFGNPKITPWNQNPKRISLQFCEPQAQNFDNWIIHTDGLSFKLKPSESNLDPNIKLNFETIEQLGGRLKKDGVLSELLQNYFRK